MINYTWCKRQHLWEESFGKVSVINQSSMTGFGDFFFHTGLKKKDVVSKEQYKVGNSKVYEWG